jgi:uncharacterized protein YgiM (DUF1202 family)
MAMAVSVAVVLLAACSGSKKPAAVAPTTTVTTASVSGTTAPGAATSSTVPIQGSGPRTVLSPVGLNVRAQASKTAAVVGTAAQGTTLTVLSHTDAGGGWYMIKGATVTGFITDNPVLSANGKFTAYGSTQHNFSALVPDQWTTTEVPLASVAFHPPSGADSIVVTTATTASQLTRSRNGYHQQSSQTMVVCGVTGDLVTFVQTAATTATSNATPATTAATGGVAERYVVQIRLTLDAQHALGVEANLADLAQVQPVKDVINSISFPFPLCQQGASPDTSSTAPATTLH